MSVPTLYRWKKLNAGLGATTVPRLKQLEEENRKHKQIVAHLTLDKQMLPLDMGEGFSEKKGRPRTLIIPPALWLKRTS